MVRALIELLITIILAYVARAVLASVFKGIANASSTAFQQQPGQTQANGSARPPSSPPPAAGELHKDPVCGTYVAESTPFRSQLGGRRFYYCSDACREKHALVAR
jgi:YHS domain-containing protein